MTGKYIIILTLWLIVAIFLLLNLRSLARFGWPALLLITGTLANALEYSLTGKIHDYFDLSFTSIPWPLFNVADVLLFTGTLWLIIEILKKPGSNDRKA